jgi:hypothetical protein
MLKNPSSFEINRVKMWVQMFMVGFFLFGQDSWVYPLAIWAWIVQEIMGWAGVWLYVRPTKEDYQIRRAIAAKTAATASSAVVPS